MTKTILFRDSDPRNPQIVAEMEINDSDSIPRVGDKMSHHVDKEGFRGAKMSVVRTFDVKEVNWYISNQDTDHPNIQSIDVVLVNDGTEVDN